MQVFNIFFKIANRNKRSAIIYLVVFIILITLMSLSGSKAQKAQFQADSYDVFVEDNDNSVLSQALVAYMDRNQKLVELRDTSKESVQDNLFYQFISYALFIPEGFEEDFLAGRPVTLDHMMRHDSGSGFFINEQLNSYLKSIQLYLAGGYSLEEAIALVDASLDESPEVAMVAFEATGSSDNSVLFYYYQYYSYVLMMMLPMTIVPILTELHKTDIAARINCAALSAKSRTLQIGLACGTLSVGLWFFFIVLSIILFGPAAIFSAKGLMLVANSIVFTMFMAGLTMFLSTFSLKDGALNLVCNIISLGMCFLCGVFVPQWLLSANVLAVGKFLPTFWYMKIVNMISGASGEAFANQLFFQYLGIESLFFLAIFLLYFVANRQHKMRELA